MSKEIMIADSTCYGYWDKGTYKENCDFDSDSIGIGPISIVLGVLIILILIFKKNSSNNLSRVSSKSLEEYVEWYKDNKDKSASFANSDIKGQYFIIKDKNGKILEEIKVEEAKYELWDSGLTNNDSSSNSPLYDVNNLKEYINIYNQDNEIKVYKSGCKVMGDYIFIYDSKGDLVDKIANVAKED